MGLIPSHPCWLHSGSYLTTLALGFRSSSLSRTNIGSAVHEAQSRAKDPSAGWVAQLSFGPTLLTYNCWKIALCMLRGDCWANCPAVNDFEPS